MPVYEYECENCGNRFERIQSVKDEPIRVCPECSGTVHKVFHPAGIIFKGSGWYITDSRKASSSTVPGETKPVAADVKDDKKTTTADTKSETKSEAKAEAKTETKVEAKTEAK